MHIDLKLDEAYKEYIKWYFPSYVEAWEADGYPCSQSFGFAANVSIGEGTRSLAYNLLYNLQLKLDKVRSLAGSLDKQLDESAGDLIRAINEFRRPVE